MTQICKKEYNEILEVLKLLPSYDYLKIPPEKILYFKEHCAPDYDFKIDNPKKIHLLKNTYALYTQLYRDYIATEEEKSIINEILDLNTKKKEQAFSVTDLFKHNNN